MAATAACVGLLVASFQAWSAPDLDPQLIGSWPGFDRQVGGRVDVSGNFAYCVGNNPPTLKIFDLSDPAKPRSVGNLELPLGGNDIKVEGGRAFVACGNAGLLVVDVGDPANPRRVGAFDTPGNAISVAVAGGKAFLLENLPDAVNPGLSAARVTAVDVSNPAFPSKLSEITIHGTSYTDFTDLSVSAGLLCVSSTSQGEGDGQGRLNIIDVTDPASPREVGTYNTSGRLASVVSAGTRAFVSPTWWNASGTEMGSLEAIDLANPAAPVRVGVYNFSGQGTVDMRMLGNLVYTACSKQSGGGVVQVLDVSQPTPVRKATFTSSTDYVAGVGVAGSNVCAVSSSSLIVLDNSDPTVLRRVGSFGSSGRSEHVAFSGNYAFVADGEAGLQVLDISDLSRPVQVGGYDTPGDAYRVAVASNYVYLADQLGGFHIFDVSNPATPRRLGGFRPTSAICDVAVSGNFAYLADVEVGLHILDISKPTAPRRVGGHRAQYAGGYHGIALSGNYVFLGEADSINFSNSGVLEVFDVSNPVFPELVGSFTTAGRAWGVGITGNYACVAGQIKDPTGASYNLTPVMEVLDISEPTAPQLVSTYYPDLHNAWRVTTSEGRAFLSGVPDGSEGTIEVVDLENPAQPRRVARLQGRLDCAVTGNRVLAANSSKGINIYELAPSGGPKAAARVETGGRASGIALAGNDVLVASEDAGLKLFSLSNPSDPQLVRSYDAAGGAKAVQSRGGRAYVAAGAAGLVILDLANPSNPQLGSLETPGETRDLVVAGDIVYVADTTAGLQVVDVSDAASPRQVGGLETTGSTMALAMLGSYLLAAQSEAGLDVLDISNPPIPRRIATLNRGGLINAVAVTGNYAVVSDRIAGFQVIDLGDPAHPKVLGTAPASSPARAIAVSGRYAYVADLLSGMAVYDIVNPASPRRVAGNGAVDGFGLVVSGDHVMAAGGFGGLLVLETFLPPLALAAVPSGTPGGMQLRIDGPAGTAARLQRSADLKAWQDWQSVTLSGQPVTVTDTMSGGGQNFYRLAP